MSSLKIKPRGFCIFCGDAKLCKGHVWPNWMKKELPSDARYHAQTRGEILSFTPKEPLSKTRTVREGHARSRKIRNTCIRCDNGWMSKLEEAAKPIALPLLRGQPAQLDGDHQKLLASWLCLMAIMAEYTAPETVSVPAEARKWLMQRLEPHPTFKVWIGRYTGSNANEHWSRHIGMNLSLEPRQDADAKKNNSQATTMVMGQFVAHILSSPIIANFDQYTGFVLYQIWPISMATVGWPGVSGLDDLQVISLAEMVAARGIQT